MRKVSFTHAFGGKSHDGVIELSEKLKEIAPCPASKVLFGTSGSEANDMQIKLTWYYNNARGKPEQEEDHQPCPRLSRRHHRLGLAHRPAVGAQ
jgi:4-aminobutyrate--pyruvate transaminase